ncbi:MAG: hypothetical protein GX154_12075 [Clostridiales bacterium]|nr:hypothetical protein [Clostridiales bacterium]
MKILLFPFILSWKIAAYMLKLTGKLLVVILGFIVLALGILLSLTIVGAIVGIPMIIIGFAMIIKGIF